MKIRNLSQLATTIALILMTTPSQADHLSGGFDIGQSAAIMTESAIPMPQGAWYLGLSYELVENQNFSDTKLIGLRAFDIVENGGAHADLHSIEQISSTRFTVGYGITENLTIGAQLPYIKRENIREPEEGHSHAGNPIVIHNVIEHGDSSGLGDLTLMGMYRFMERNDANFAFLFGVKLATGDNDENGFRNEVFVTRIDTGVIPDDHDDEGHHHEGTRLETHQQPGSGSRDAIFGLAYSSFVGSFSLDSSLIYTFVSEGSQETNLGDSFKYNLALAYPFSEQIDLVLELNGETRDREVRGSEVIGNSGGSHVYLSPGIRFRTGGDWSASLSYGIPIRERLNGYQSDPEQRWLATLSLGL